MSNLAQNAYKVEWLRSLPRSAAVFPTTAPAFALPFTFDAALYASQALHSPWTGATFTVGSGVISNTPAMGAEILTDPGLEANYTAGLCDTLTMNGAPTVAQSADVHGGAKAQEFKSNAFNDRLNFAAFAGIANTWYLGSAWIKKIAGVACRVAIRMDQVGGFPSASQRQLINATPAYAQKRISFFCSNANNIYFYPAIETNAAGDTIIADDCSAKTLTNDDLFAMLPSASRIAYVKIKPSDDADGDGTFTGCVAWGNGDIPDTFVVAVYTFGYLDDYINVGLWKCVSGVYTSLIAMTAFTEVPDAWIEIRPVDDVTVSLWYDNAQVGINQTINDVPGDQAGIMITGGNNPEAFYWGNTDDINILFAGSSFSVLGSTSYNQVIRDLIADQPIYTGYYTTMAQGGVQAWYNLVMLPSYLTSSLQWFIVDTANDSTNSSVKDKASLEALIRRVLDYNPAIKIVLVSAPSWNGQDITNDANTPTPSNLADLNAARVIGNYYGVNYAPYLDQCIYLVANGYKHLNELVSVDTVHPTATGYSLMARCAGSFIPDGGVACPAVMPSRLMTDTADFEQEPLRMAGTAYNARVGVWVDTGTSTASVTAGSTITYSGTFRSFGYYNAAASYSDVSVTIDGGAPINPFNTNRNGYDIGIRAAHTVVITVLTNCTIDEFWAI